jgi:ankyrin repeat protein
MTLVLRLPLAYELPISVVSIGLQKVEGFNAMNDILLYSIARRFALVTVLLAAATVCEAGSLLTAIQEDDLSQVEQEIANGADVTEEDMFLGAPIVLAAILGNVQIVELLLDQGALVQIEDHVSGTPLHAAAINGHLSVVKILIEHGSNIEAKRASNGETP